MPKASANTMLGDRRHNRPEDLMQRFGVSELGGDHNEIFGVNHELVVEKSFQFFVAFAIFE